MLAMLFLALRRFVLVYLARRQGRPPEAGRSLSLSRRERTRQRLQRQAEQLRIARAARSGEGEA